MRPSVSARKNRTSESAPPSISGYSEGSTASTRSRLSEANWAMKPLCIHSQRSWRNGWQLVCCTADPIAARTWAKKCPELTCSASSWRLRSFHAGSMLRKMPGVGLAKRMAVGLLYGRPDRGADVGEEVPGADVLGSAVQQTNCH